MLSRPLLDAVIEVADRDPEIRALYLFGSRATGHERPDSDVDIGVLYRHRQPPTASLMIAQQIEELAGGYVDVVDVGGAGAFLALDIVRGERLFCRDDADADRFELYVLRRAGDLLPFERERQALLLDTPPR